MTTRAGFVALIGEPNAGKSTLLNRMVGAKVSIVTHKVQTTRARIRGVALEGDAQLVFVDTPGLFRRAAGSTAPWSPPPGAGRPMPTWWCC
jgi:GTP-binding protein Era